MLRSRFSEKYGRNGLNTTPKSRKDVEEQPFLSERNLALFGLLFSFVIVFSKIYFEYFETIEKLVFERKLVSYQVLTENGQVMFTNSWKSAVRYSGLWLPLVCGLLSTYFTWMCVYMDSSVPGVYPPSPLSPQKYRVQSGHTFHLNYIFAVLVGLLVTICMYFKGVSIEYYV